MKTSSWRKWNRLHYKLYAVLNFKTG